MSEPELWNRRQIADYLGITLSSVSTWLARHGVASAGFREGDHGRPEKLYPAADVRARQQAAPGKGNRTPRKTPNGS